MFVLRYYCDELDEIWTRLPDSGIAQLDQSVVAKYLPVRLSVPAQQPEKPNPAPPGNRPMPQPRCNIDGRFTSISGHAGRV